MIQLRYLPLMFCAAAWADSGTPTGLTVTFNGGTALEIRTESTLKNSPLSTSGSVSVSDRNEVRRTVVDKQGRLIFAYEIEAAPEPGMGGRYTIRIRPNDPNRIDLMHFTFAPGDELIVGDSTACTVRADGTITVRDLGEFHAAGLSLSELGSAVSRRSQQRGGSSRVNISVKAARRDVPTVSSVREFKGVRIGEAVSIDILYNPSTGERIYDVIQPLTPGPKFAAPSRETPRPAEEEFSLMKMKLSLNGKVVEEDQAWMIGGALKISIPGHGAVYLAIQPATTHAFQPVGRVEKNKLTFPLGTDLVEITGAQNIMSKSAYRTIWVWWDQSAPDTKSVDVTCSGTIEALLPK